MLPIREVTKVIQIYTISLAPRQQFERNSM